MKLLNFLYVLVIIAQTAIESDSLSANISNDVTKKFDELEKIILLKMQKLQKENEYLQMEIYMLHQKTNINFECCKLQPDNVCGPCLR